MNPFMATRRGLTTARSGVRSPVAVALSVVGLLLIWVILARIFADLRVVPQPWAVLQAMWEDRNIYSGNISTTLSEAAIGFFWGNVLAIALAGVFVQVPAVERLLLRIAVASYCVPLVAIAPILVVVLPGNAPKEALAGLSVFFTTLTAAVLGLRSADRSALDLIHSLGGGSFFTLRKLRLLSALPSLFAGLKIAAPAALLGAIIGEYLGSSNGLGVMLVQAQSSFQVARTWAVALVISALAGLGYALVAIIARWLTPGRPGRERGGGCGIRGSRRRTGAVPARRHGWTGRLHPPDRGRLVRGHPGFRPRSVLREDAGGRRDLFVRREDAADHRQRLLSALGITLLDAGVGYVVGLIVASLAAAVLVAFRRVEQIVLPLAIVLRSIPCSP
ncbi:ABC transporter permease [Streptosporangium lutulentum]